jgi:hypothetical protein
VLLSILLSYCPRVPNLVYFHHLLRTHTFLFSPSHIPFDLLLSEKMLNWDKLCDAMPSIYMKSMIILRMQHAMRHYLYINIRFKIFDLPCFCSFPHSAPNMSGPPRRTNTYTCTCTHFCGGYKTGLSKATYYRHAPYRAAPQPSFSPSFQNFLDNSAGSGAANQTGQEESHRNTDNLGAKSPTPQVLGSSPENSVSKLSFLIYLCSTEAVVDFRNIMMCITIGKWIWIWIIWYVQCLIWEDSGSNAPNFFSGKPNLY